MTKKRNIWIYPFILIGMLLMLLNSCKKDNNNNNSNNSNPIGTVTDIDGNVYHYITIGTQVWMVENLKTTKYRDGTIIPNVTTNSEWINLTTGAYSDYDNNPTNSVTFGRLYNWYAVKNTHNIAPLGWHVPTEQEWSTLISFLGGKSVAGGKLKEIGTTHWTSPNTGATNETSFTALPGGYRFGISEGVFSFIGGNGYWWSSTDNNMSGIWGLSMGCGSSNVSINYYNKSSGLSVRCLKD